MKDIDFDELDKAVGSVLGTADEPDTTNTPDVTPSSASQSVMSAPSAPAVDTSAVSSDTPAVKPPVAPARRRGQFLDMVHPSADMRSRSPLPPSASHRTLTPLNDTTAPEPPTPDVAAPEPESTSMTTPDESSVTSEAFETPIASDTSETNDESSTQAAHSWPDPIDFATRSSDTPSIEDNEVTSDKDSTSESEVADNDQAQTPFVTDAKVNKRPLGAFAMPELETTADESSSPSDTEQPVADTTPQTAPLAEPLAPELSADVNSVESVGVESVEEPTPVEPFTPAAKPQEPAPVEEPVQPAAPVAAPTSAALNHSAAASIPQQYKPATPIKDDDKAEHPLFDTEEYHQPLLPSGKKKSRKGVLIVLLLILLLLVGAGLGYLAFVLGIF